MGDRATFRANPDGTATPIAAGEWYQYEGASIENLTFDSLRDLVLIHLRDAGMNRKRVEEILIGREQELALAQTVPWPIGIQWLSGASLRWMAGELRIMGIPIRIVTDPHYLAFHHGD